MTDVDHFPPKVREFVRALQVPVAVHPYGEATDALVRQRRERFGEYMLLATVIVELASRVVLIRQHFGEHLEGGVWKLPGGGVEHGEDIAAAAIREVREETGLDVELTTSVGLFKTGRRAPTVGTIDAFVAVFAARAVGGALRKGDPDEIAAVRLATMDEIEQLIAAGLFSSSQNPHFRAGEIACLRRWAGTR